MQFRKKKKIQTKQTANGYSVYGCADFVVLCFWVKYKPEDMSEIHLQRNIWNVVVSLSTIILT